MRITVANLKGGASKTTTAIYLATGLARTGRVLLVDADTGQGSAKDWSELAGDTWPDSIRVVAWSTRDLARRIARVADEYDHIVTDIDPKSPDLLRQSLIVAPVLIIPVMPRPMDIRELTATFDVAAQVDSDEHPITASVLLVQTRGPRHRLSNDSRRLLQEHGRPVMNAQTAVLDCYSLAHGTAVQDLHEYEDVLAEILADEEQTA